MDNMKQRVRALSSGMSPPYETSFLAPTLKSKIVVIGDENSHAQSLISTFTHHSSPINYVHSMRSGTAMLLTFHFLEPAENYETMFKKLTNDIQAVIYVFNIYSSENWRQNADQIAWVLMNTNIPCFMIGTRIPIETPDGIKETRVIQAASVLAYVDNSPLFEFYLESDFGVYCNSDSLEESKIVIEPVLRSILRIESHKNRKQFLDATEPGLPAVLTLRNIRRNSISLSRSRSNSTASPRAHSPRAPDTASTRASIGDAVMLDTNHH